MALTSHLVHDQTMTSTSTWQTTTGHVERDIILWHCKIFVTTKGSFGVWLAIYQVPRLIAHTCGWARCGTTFMMRPCAWMLLSSLRIVRAWDPSLVVIQHTLYSHGLWRSSLFTRPDALTNKVDTSHCAAKVIIKNAFGNLKLNWKIYAEMTMQGIEFE